MFVLGSRLVVGALSCSAAARLFSPADAHRMYVEGELVKVGRRPSLCVVSFSLVRPSPFTVAA